MVEAFDLRSFEQCFEQIPALAGHPRTVETLPGGLTLQVACQFLPMPSWEQELVIQHVFQLQREQLQTDKMRRNGHQSGVCK